jgi:hypothetical protein
VSDDEPRQAVRDHLGLDTGGLTGLPGPRTHRQSDDLNEAWAARYTEERSRRSDAESVLPGYYDAN